MDCPQKTYKRIVRHVWNSFLKIIVLFFYFVKINKACLFDCFQKLFLKIVFKKCNSIKQKIENNVYIFFNCFVNNTKKYLKNHKTIKK